MILFIPDISGFTNFVKSVEVEHSKHIISELLEALIASNALNMELAEIEGDALFYYLEDDKLSHTDLINHIRQLYLTFHTTLRTFESKRICQCGACTSTTHLKLKFVSHYGPSNFIEIVNTKKPYGPDVISIHRLLKNEIEENEYVLITDQLKEQLTGMETSLQWINKQEEYDIEKIDYSYANISEWESNLSIHIAPIEAVPTSESMVNFSLNIDKSPDLVYEYLSNFELKKLWNDNIDVLFEEGKINQVGSKHICVVDGNQINFETIKVAKPESETITYGEVTQDAPMLKELKSFIFLEPKGKSTNFKAIFQLQPKNKLIRLLLPLLKGQIKKNLKESFLRLKTVVEATDE